MRGKLRIYLGAAPGVGKTFAMLNEGRRRRERGTDVVIGLVVTHDRPQTIAQIGDLPIVPPRRVAYRGGTWTELDVDAVLARRPEVVLVDELAHSNVPGSQNEKRWEDIEQLLAAGIEVISTVNIQHLESLNDVVNRITGITQRETVPDVAVRRADQIELVDMSPEALRRRMAHGNIYAPEKVDAALGNYFRLGNLAALRELALLWVADRVEDSLQRYMAERGITSSWETRERVLVALTGAPGGADLVRRAARMARRTKGELIGVHVGSGDGLVRPAQDMITRHKKLVEELGGSFHEVVGGDVPATLVAFATSQHATQIVMGTSRRSRWTELMRGSIINRVVRDAKGIDVHVIAVESVARQRRRRDRLPITPVRNRRVAAAYAIAVAAALLFGVLAAEKSALHPSHPGWVTSSAGLLLFLTVVVVVAAIGGRVPGLVTAGIAVLLVDWYLIPPYRSFAVARGTDAAALAAFLVTAVVVAIAVDQAARRRVEALTSRHEADTVLALADRLVQPNPPQVVVEEIHDTLRRRAVALLAQTGDTWIVEASAGDPVPCTPHGGEHFALRDGRVLVLTGPPLRADQQRLVAALVSYLDAIIAIHRLHEEVREVETLSSANDLRNALLAAVSHDLRTPLASIKALTSGWLEPDVEWGTDDTTDFMRSIDNEADRLNKLVENLLDMSRLHAGSLQPAQRPVCLDEVVPAALAGLSGDAREVVVDVPESLPRVDVDPALLERVIANLVDNAVKHASNGSVVRVEAAQVADRVDVRVVDRGPGIPVAHRDRVFQPFQRLGDAAGAASGIGLGLAVARGFVEALHGEISVEDTPGGGVTMVVGLPIATTRVLETTEQV
jgi:two-component system sensor histidine kinase KdpD